MIMKRLTSAKSEDEMLRDYPRRSASEGWFIRVKEVANCCWEAEAKDRFGHVVGLSSMDGDPDKLIEEIEILILEYR